MKKALFLLIILYWCLQPAFAQVFAPLGAKWTFVHQSGTDPMVPCSTGPMYSYEVTEERQVQGRTVSVITGCEEGELLIWNDSARIYFFENDTFRLLIDYNISVGDSFYHEIPTTISCSTLPCCCTLTHGKIKSIVVKDTTVVVSGAPLRQLTVHSYYSEFILGDYHWISRGEWTFTERVGHFVRPIIGGPAGECCLGYCCSNAFLCYEDNEFYYETGFGENCEYTSIGEAKFPAIEISPNPVQHVLFIHSGVSGMLNIYAADGRLVERMRFSGNQQIDTRKWQNSVYVIKITTEKNEVISKIVKQ